MEENIRRKYLIHSIDLLVHCSLSSRGKLNLYLRSSLLQSVTAKSKPRKFSQDAEMLRLLPH